MAISLVTSGSHHTWTEGSSFTITGIQNGDFVLLMGAADNTPSAIGAPTGFTLGESVANDIPDCMWAYTFATGTSLSVSGLDGDTGGGSLFEAVGYLYIVLRGVDSTNPINTDATVATVSGTDSTSINCNSVTTTVDNCWVIPIGMLDDVNTASSVTAPSGYTSIANYDVPDNGSGNLGATIMTSYKEVTTAGTEDPGAYTFSTGNESNGFTIAIAPAAAPTPTPTPSTTPTLTPTPSPSGLPPIGIGTGVSLNQVRTYLGLGAQASLIDCFAIAVDEYFDPTYSGSKDRLGNFQGYQEIALSPTPTPTSTVTPTNSPTPTPSPSIPAPSFPVIESYSTATTGGTASTTITFGSAPTGLSAGDLIILLVANERNNDWLFQNVTGYTRQTFASNANDIQLGVYYRIATGDSNDGFPNLTVQHCTSNEFAVGWALRVTNINSTTPLVFGSYNTGIGASTQTLPSVTTSVDNCLVIGFSGYDGSDVDPISINSGTGWTVQDYLEDDGGDAAIGVGADWYIKEMATAGSTGNLGLSHGNDGWAGVQIIIQPS